MRRKIVNMNSTPKTRIIILITLGIIFVLLPKITINLSFITGSSDKSLEYSDDISIDNEYLKISAVSEKIHINNNWTTAKAVGICTGNGTYSEPYVIEDLVIDSGESGSCIWIENSDVFFRIENCTTNNSGEHDERITGTFRDWAAGIKISNTTNGMLINNSCSFNYMGIYLLVSINISVSGNNASNNYQGIFMSYVDDGDSLYKYPTKNIITGNNASFNTRYGIRLGGGGYNVVSGNRANNNGNYAAGIFLIGNEKNVVMGNIANNNYRSGIHLDNSHYNNISGNIVNNNGNDGFLILSSNNTVSGNNASNNGGNGIGMAFGDENIISGNTVSSNLVGMYFWNGANDNIIYFNNFFTNSINSLSLQDTINIWNSPGKIIYSYNGKNYTNYLGNYYDNYLEIDVNNNGIGDTPYTYGEVIDNYPLMEPIENYEIIEMLEPSEENTSGGGIPGYNLFVLLGILSIVAIILSKKLKKS